jgi:hypothetical protein
METEPRGFQPTKGLLHEESEQPLAVTRSAVVVVGALASVGLGVWLYRANAPTLDIVAVQLGGRAQRWPPPDGTQAALNWDYALILGYGTFLALGTTAATRVSRGAVTARAARLGQGTAVVGVAADVVENLLLTAAVQGVGDRGMMLDAARVAATVKFVALPVAAVVAVAGLVSLGVTAWRHRRRERTVGRTTPREVER